MTATIHHGDCLDVLRQMPDNSVHAIVTDPPYGLSNTSPEQVADTIVRWVSGDREYLPGGVGFMNKSWDAFVPPVAVWDEAMRVLKPGGHVLAFAGTRTMDLMTLGLRLAGFDIRDAVGYASGMVAWVYGSGFPKSHNPGRDKRFCQCEENGKATEAATPEGLHGMRGGVHATGQVSTPEEADVLAGVRTGGSVGVSHGSGVAQRPARDGGMCSMRNPSQEVAKQGGASGEDVLRPLVPCEGSCACPDALRREHEGPEGHASIRGGEPGMEGRSDVQAGEGELHRPALRQMPGGMADDGPEGRVHHGAPPSHGSVGRQAATANGSGEPHQPEPEGQPQGEPGAVPLERGSQAGRGRPVCDGCGKPLRPEGLGSALKPAWEPVIMARKPLEGTLAANVLEHGTGGLNVDACRINPGEAVPGGGGRKAGGSFTFGGCSSMAALEALAANGAKTPNGEDARTTLQRAREYAESKPHTSGRWPANVILDEHMAGVLDEQSGIVKSGGSGAGSNRTSPAGNGHTHGRMGRREQTNHPPSEGGASRFFYVAKASKRERPDVDGIKHPTVKPLALMQWLVRLVTPPNGIVLDPFAGSGTTVEAAMLEGFDCIGIEREAEYLPLIRHRIERATEQLATEDPEQGSFSFEETA